MAVFLVLALSIVRSVCFEYAHRSMKSDAIDVYNRDKHFSLRENETLFDPTNIKTFKDCNRYILSMFISTFSRVVHKAKCYNYNTHSKNIVSSRYNNQSPINETQYNSQTRGRNSLKLPHPTNFSLSLPACSVIVIFNTINRMINCYIKEESYIKVRREEKNPHRRPESLKKKFLSRNSIYVYIRR